MHYHRTCEAWLRRLDRNKDEVLPILRDVYGSEAQRWFHRWRIFFIACSELFAYEAGTEWFVAHYRWERRA
jgi:cyclopropane-fatty-acyl-phospholipid synthase